MSASKTSFKQNSKKIQNTIEHFTNKAKPGKKRKEKASRKQKQTEENSISHEIPTMEPHSFVPNISTNQDISLLPQILTKRPEMYQPTAINPYGQFISQFTDIAPNVPKAPEEMIANCIYYGHMFHSSLMAVRVSF
jgi:hypothetical protein